MATLPGIASIRGASACDHVGLRCSSGEEVYRWAEHLDALGFQRGPVEDVPYGWAVTARDPDGIPVEFFCLKDR
jgi:catechol 2,3-dioxygenase-like lactoylglutathione lyase family enzyme